jgi:hypothetical protein
MDQIKGLTPMFIDKEFKPIDECIVHALARAETRYTDSL